MSHPVKLKFVGYQIERISFEKPKDVTGGDFNVNLKHDNVVEPPNEDGISIVTTEMLLSLSDDNSKFDLQVQMFGTFEIFDLSDELVLKNYLDISIPSILYPYMRAFVTNIVVQTGMKPVILPPINFGYKPLAPPEEGQEESTPLLGE